MNEKVLYFKKDGEAPIWDFPYVRARRVFPHDAKTVTTLDVVLSLFNRGIFKQIDVEILKVIGDAQCLTIEQLKRYMSKKSYSYSQVGSRVDFMRKYGLIDRWKIRLLDDEDDEVKPSAPLTLGIGGYKILAYYYDSSRLVLPEHWNVKGVGSLQRMILLNEFRVNLAERSVMKKWEWHTPIISDSKVDKPFAVTEVNAGGKGVFRWILEMPQQAQDYLGYLKKKLHSWQYVQKESGDIVPKGFPNGVSVVIIYASTYSLATHIHEQLLLDTFPFKIWVVCEEDFKDGFHKSFYLPVGKELKRFQLDFLTV